MSISKFMRTSATTDPGLAEARKLSAIRCSASGLLLGIRSIRSSVTLPQFSPMSTSCLSRSCSVRPQG